MKNKYKEFIKNIQQDIAIFNKQGNISSMLHRTNIFKQKYKQQLYELTSFLPTNASVSQRMYHLLKGLTNIQRCIECNNEVQYKTYLEGYREYCSAACSNKSNKKKIKKEQTMIDRYGKKHALQVKEFKQKSEQTMIDRYDSNMYFSTDYFKKQRNKTMLLKYGSLNYNNREKAKSTCNEHYGVDFYSQSQECKDKVKTTNIEKYGMFYTQTQECKNKIKQTNNEKYGYEHTFQVPTVIEKARLTNIQKYEVDEAKRKHWSTEFKLNWNNADWIIAQFSNYSLVEICKVHNVSESWLRKNIHRLGLAEQLLGPANQVSSSELEIVKFLQNLGIKKIIQSDRSVLNGKELDILLPDYNLAIEFNGVYWHSEQLGKDRLYHKSKTDICKQQGIQLLHIYDVEWNSLLTQNIWKSMIKSRLKQNTKIYARKCQVRSISTITAREFFNNNHLNGFAGGSIKYGLFYNNELVQAVIIGKSRFNSKYNYELIRMASKQGITVVGGVGKLLKKAPSSLISYANIRYSNGNGYKSVGMTYQYTSPPNYHYIVDSKLKSRNKYQKHKLCKVLLIYDEELSEYENMLVNGYDRIWDCGNLVYTR